MDRIEQIKQEIEHRQFMDAFLIGKSGRDNREVMASLHIELATLESASTEAPSGGRKFDQGKNRLSLIPVKCLNAIMHVLEFGALKYEVDNWQKVPDASNRYYDAAIRHLFAWREGESIDPESGHYHLAHAACCVIFMLWFDLSKKDNQ